MFLEVHVDEYGTDSWKRSSFGGLKLIIMLLLSGSFTHGD